MGLNVNYVRGGGGPVKVQLSGSIDEQAKVPEVLEAIKEDAVLNLSRIERINSIGLLHWLRGMASLSERQKVAVEAVPYPLSIQANRMLDLFGKAKVLSCLAPYFCGKCKTNREVEVLADEVKSQPKGAPTKACPNCKSEMEFDEMDEYFTFIRDPAT